MSYCIRNKPWPDLLLKITLEISGVNAEKLDKKYQILQFAWILWLVTKNITELFGRKYNELYNSVSYDKDEFLTLRNENGCNIKMYCIDDNVNIISSTMYILMLLMLNMFLMRSHT